MDPIESGFRRRSNFWVGVMVLMVLCAAAVMTLRVIFW
jgi:hypothetical protein